MKNILILLVSLSFIAIGCNKPPEDTTDGTHEIVDQDVHSSDHDESHTADSHHDHATDGDVTHSNVSEGGLVLNASDKWEADEHTNNSVAKMHEMVEQVKMQKEPDYDGLAAKLKLEVQNLVKGCTMNGDAHDQLHIWLNDYMKRIVKLSDKTDEQGREIALNNLAESLHNYSEYFK
jgi:hypothetical protein